MEKMPNINKYNRIPYHLRCKLIEKVCEDSIPCVLAGRELGISPSTAKMIVKKYKETGEIFEKKEDKIKRECLKEYQEGKNVQTNDVTEVGEACVPIYFYVPISLVYDGFFSKQLF